MLDGGGVIDAALEAMRRIRRKIVAPCAALDRLRIPEGRFEVDVGGVERDGGGIAAHDAGERFDRFVIGDHAYPVVDVDGTAVQELERLARAAPAHVQSAMDLRQIEHMRWPAQFQHHVIGDVDQRRNRPLSTALETLLHPARCRRTGIEVADDATGKTAAQVRRADRGRQDLVARHGNRLEHRRDERHAGERRYFTCHAEHRQTIGLVRCQLDRELHVVQLMVVPEVLPDRRIVRQVQQAAMVVRQLQFLCGAQHSLRFDAAQLSDLDLERLAVFARRQHGANQRARDLHPGAHVRRAADDGERGAGTGIDLADVEPVGIRMAGDFQHLGDHHAGKWRGDRHRFLDLESGHRQKMGELVGSQVRVGHRAQPVFRELHVLILLLQVPPVV